MTDLRKAAEMALKALDYEAREEPESIWIAERDALRQALAEDALDRMVAENQRLGLYENTPAVKTYCGGKPNYCTPEVAKRKTLAELLASTPVDETAKGEHEQKTPLKVLNLTVFTENRLRNGRVYDVETLQTMTNRDILAIPDIGKKALAEVLEALAKLKEKNHG